HLTRYASFNVKRLGLSTVQLEGNPFQIEYDVGCIFDYTRYRRELVEHTLDFYCGNRRTFDRREQGPAQAISNRGAEAALKWLRIELRITVCGCLGFARQTLRPLETNHELSFCSVHCFLSIVISPCHSSFVSADKVTQ